ncbi:MAG TPA: hypothetical protein PK760_01200 [Flavobacteriales bacterium]|nr:hypothetical protein [Flavobacteriales bacterium]
MSVVDLVGKSTVKRRIAAIALRKSGAMGDDTCDMLLQALKLEGDHKNWETNVELLTTIGELHCSACAEFILETIIQSNTELGMIAIEGGRAYVRITRNDLSDVRSVLSILEMRRYSSAHGCLNALGYDKMIPSLEDQERILTTCWKLGANRQKGLADPRYGLAAACAGWKAPSVRAFLEDCLATGDVPLQYIANASLQNKYVKLR